MEYPNLNWGQTDQNNQQFGNGGYGYNNNNTSMDPMSYNVGRYGQAIALVINDLISNRYIPNQQIANQLYNYAGQEVGNGRVSQFFASYNRQLADNDIYAICRNRLLEILKQMRANMNNQNFVFRPNNNPFGGNGGFGTHYSGNNGFGNNGFNNNGFGNNSFSNIYSSGYGSQFNNGCRVIQPNGYSNNGFDQPIDNYQQQSQSNMTVGDLYKNNRTRSARSMSTNSARPEPTYTETPTFTQQRQASVPPKRTVNVNQFAKPQENVVVIVDGEPVDYKSAIDDVVKTFLEGAAKRYKATTTSANGVNTEQKVDVATVNMKYPVDDIKQAYNDLDSVDLNVDKQDHMVVANFDEIVVVRGNNDKLTRAFNEVMNVYRKTAKDHPGDIGYISFEIIKAINAQGDEFKAIMEDKICELFNQVLRITGFNLLDNMGHHKALGSVKSFEDIEDLYADLLADQLPTGFENKSMWAVGLISCLSSSVLAIFNDFGERILNLKDETNKQAVLNNKDLSLKVGDKPYRLLPTKELTEEQQKLIDESLKKVFAFKVRRRVIFHNHRPYDFAECDTNNGRLVPYRNNNGSEAIMHQILFDGDKNKTEPNFGVALMVDIDHPDQFEHPYMIGSSFNNQLVASKAK